jgi:hypothetical protein
VLFGRFFLRGTAVDLRRRFWRGGHLGNAAWGHVYWNASRIAQPMVRVVVDIDPKSYRKIKQARSYIEETTGVRPSVSELVHIHFAMLFAEP